MAVKVVHYLRHLGLGGTEKTCQLFFEHLRGVDQCVVYEKSGTHPRLEEFQKAADVCDGYLCEIDSYKDGEPTGTELQNFLHLNNVNILHVYRSGYGEFPENGVHVNVPACVETNVFGFYDPNPRITKTLFMSKWLHDRFSKRIGPINRAFMKSRFDWINNPVEMPYTDKKLSIRETWGPDCTILGRVGRPDNGIYNSVNVDAARLLRMQGYDVRFLVVAPPSNMVNDLVNYEIPFYVVEPTTNPLILSQAYNTMDILAHARADGETFGVNIAEAMMHGKPVVTHIAYPSNPSMGVFQAQTELVDDGESGFVVENNPGEYAEALRSIITSKVLAESMGYYATVKAMREYHVDVCVEKLKKIYEEIVP